MQYQYEFVVTEELIAKAVRRFWLQYVGWVGLLRWFAVAVALILSLLFVHQALFTGFAWAAVILVPLIWLAGYVVFLSRAYSRYKRMDSKLITYRFTEDVIGTRSDLGTAEFPWRMLDKVRRFPDVWLLFVGRRDYVYLPAEHMDKELQMFIIRQAENHNIPVT